jgi:NADPH2:quinone reductase
MKAYVYGASGPAISDVPKPEPKGTQVLVRVRACALNRADIGMTKGHAHGSAGGVGTLLGMEWAGEVAALGPDAKGVAVGDRVMGSGAAAFAEYTLADHGRLFHAPATMPFEEAATLPIALTTMHNAVVTVGGLQAGQSVLIQGASSGVGLMGLQIAKSLGAKTVIGTSTHAGRRARLTEFGADLAVDTSDPAWPDEVLKATDGAGVHLSVDQVSGRLVNGLRRCGAILGRIVNVGRLGGGKAEFDFDLHATRRIDYIGVTHRTRTVDELREETRVMWADLAAAVKAGKFKLPIDKTFPLAEAKAAQDYMRANSHFGKIVLVP